MWTTLCRLTECKSLRLCDLQDPLSLAAPRKANWDLRRDVAKKLEKLERRTQRALLLIMQQEQEAAAAGQAITDS